MKIGEVNWNAKDEEGNEIYTMQFPDSVCSFRRDFYGVEGIEDHIKLFKRIGLYGKEVINNKMK